MIPSWYTPGLLYGGGVPGVKMGEHQIETQKVSLSKTEIKFPLIHSKKPGSLSLDNETIANVLEKEDLYRTQS
jgi:hypothetical protein